MRDAASPIDLAQRRLSSALRAVRLAEGHVPCEKNPSLWTSNDRADREAASHRCGTCPVRTECADASSAEHVGVWGSRIRLAGSLDW
ncbi:WhiB family transcriptional regulator [Allobranchiibius sp. CTAmp26]|uniref:WhiB family transcriptional regulator n=1 Tax=Allobranchiibius sp. CTAmp26 TaxID=2815214 RepID=UPI001AA184DB|nr:WhiB family transcriptional regulator [Allobranchiibius sp. CTAmp26]